MKDILFKNNGSKNTILYLHGWASNINLMKPLSLNLEDYNELFLEYEGPLDNVSHPYSIQNYLDDIIKIINDYPVNIRYIVGHSFGGKLAVKLTFYLNDVKGLFLISPSLLNKRRGLRYFFRVYGYKFLKKTNLIKLVKNKQFGSEDYKNATPIMKETIKNIVNETCLKEIKFFSLPTLLLWGDNDTTTPFYLAKKIKKRMKNCEIIRQKGDHFAYLQNPNTKLILKEFIKGEDADDYN